MKMSKRAETALRKSIKHWEIDVLKNRKSPTDDNCPLCQLYFWKNNVKGCSSACPIFNKTKQRTCNGTPYDSYCNAMSNKNILKMKEHARRMIKFMKALLPKKKG